MAQGLGSLWLSLLCACVVASPSLAAEPSLRIVTQGNPDPVQLLKILESRLSTCQAILRARGQAATEVQLPSLRQLKSLVTQRDELLVDGDSSAKFSTQSVLLPDASAGCRISLANTYTALVEQRCRSRISGGAKANVLGSAEPAEQAPQVDTEVETPNDTALCFSNKPKPRKMASYIRGTTPAGSPCFWLTDPGNAVAPNVPGLHSCMHPRFLSGTLDYLSGSSLVLWSVNVPAAQENDYLKNLPDINRGQFEATVVEEGKPVPAARFLKSAVQLFVQQPLWVALGAKP